MDDRELLLAELSRRIAKASSSVVTLEKESPVYRSDLVTGRSPSANQTEELVRALYIHYLVHDLGYAPELISMEHPVPAKTGRGQGDKYVDIVIWKEKSGQAANCFCLLEIKTPDAYYQEHKDAWEGQLFGISKFIDPRPSCLAYGTWQPEPSGLGLPILEVVDSSMWHSYKEWNSNNQPIQSDIIPKNYDKPIKSPYIYGSSVKDLKRDMDEREATFLQRHLHNVLWGGGSSTDSEIFNLLTRLIFAKAFDEMTALPDEEYQFQTKEGETLESTLMRITDLYQEALMKRLSYPEEIATNRPIREAGKGTEAQIRFAIEQLEKYHLTDLANSSATPDLLGGLFEYIMRTGFKQSKGQFFTHPNIAKFLVDILQIGEQSVEYIDSGKELPKIMDPSAGAGTFLIAAMNSISENVREYERDNRGKRSQESEQILSSLIDQPRRNEWAKNTCYGIELNSDLGLAAQVNMFVHGDGSSSIFTGQEEGDGLAPFSSYTRKDILSSSELQDYQFPVSETFDFVITNPPFSVKFTDNQIETYRKTFSLASETQNSEELFIERWFQLLKPGGRLGAVVPNSLLDSRSETPARNFLLRHFWIKAIISLPSDAFYPHTMTKTSLLIAEKKDSNDNNTFKSRSSIPLEKLLEENGDIIFGQVSYLGYQRTAKGEKEDQKNDLNAILSEAETLNLWNSKSSEVDNKILRIVPSDAIPTKPTVRLDAEYALQQSLISSPMPIKEIFVLSEFPEIDSEPTDVYNYCEIGDIDRMGLASPRIIDSSIQDDNPEMRKQIDRIRKKVQQGKAMKPDSWCVLVPKTRPYLKKFAIVNGKENSYFTTDFFVLKPGDHLIEHSNEDEGNATCMLLLLLKGELNSLLTSLSRWGKSYPTLHKDDLSSASIDQQVFEKMLTPELINDAKLVREKVNSSIEARNNLLQIIQRVEG